MSEYLILGLGGFLGVNARYFVGIWAAQKWGTAFPSGTLLINLSGSFVLGFFLAAATDRFLVDPRWRLFFAVGFLGAYTTFSAYTYESVRLALSGSWGLALANLLANNLAGFLAVLLGIALGRGR